METHLEPAKTVGILMPQLSSCVALLFLKGIDRGKKSEQEQHRNTAKGVETIIESFKFTTVGIRLPFAKNKITCVFGFFSVAIFSSYLAMKN